MEKKEHAAVEEYIASFPESTQKQLNRLMDILKGVAPEAEVSIKWGSPVFTQNRILFAVAAFKKHINFYPTPSTLRANEEKLTSVNTTKTAIQLPLEAPLPEDLIKDIAEYRKKDVLENDAKWIV